MYICTNIQISMNVKGQLIHVQRMLLVPTLRVAISVLVILVLLEMALLAVSDTYMYMYTRINSMFTTSSFQCASDDIQT